MLQTVIAVALWHVHTGIRLYEKFFTRCQLTVRENNHEYRLLLGFGLGGLFVYRSNLDHDSYGVAAVRK
jgi:hypothetical protein